MHALWIRYRGLIVVGIGLVLFMGTVPLHTQDGPNHRTVAMILDRLDSSPVEAGVYQSHLGLFQTNTLFPLSYRMLSGVLTPEAHERVFMAFFLLLIPVVYQFFLSAWWPRSRSLWVIVLPLWFHPLFITGMYNFLASVPLTLIALALLRKGLAELRPGPFAAFVACCWLLLLAHPFPFFVLPVALVAAAALDRDVQRRALVAYGLTVLVLLVAGFGLPLLSASADVTYPYTFKPLAELLGGLLIYNVAAYSVWHLVLVTPFFLMLLLLMMHAARTGTLRTNLFWMALLAGYLVFPNEGRGGAHVNERFLPFLWCALPVGLAVQDSWVRYLRYVSIATTLVMAAWFVAGMRQVDTAVRSAREVMASLPDSTRLYPINFDPHGPALTYSSLLHLWAVYEQPKVVFSPYLFAYMQLMPLARRHPAGATYFPATAENLPERIATNRVCRPDDAVETVNCRAAREQGYNRILAHASYYDYWFIYQPPEEFIGIVRSVPGARLVAENGSASLWSFMDALPFEPRLW